MLEPMGICEKHELPLDGNGECELCRLGQMHSDAPPSPSAWWALIIPLLLLGAGVAWAISSMGPDPEIAPQQGVRAPEARPAGPAAASPRPSQPEPEIAPPPPEPPPPKPNIPIEDIPVPKPPEPNEAAQKHL